MNQAIAIGVSACLLGHPVRYDGQHQCDPFIIGTLGRFLQLVPVCPEFDSGLGAPRETMRLVGEAEAPRLLTTESGIDRTCHLLAWAEARLDEMVRTKDLQGFILKSRSPSCGRSGVKLFPSPGQGGDFRRVGVGLFAGLLRRQAPFLPLIDEVGLHDLPTRALFIEQLFAFQRWQEATANDGETLQALLRFHTTHKLQIRTHCERRYRALGRLVAEPTSGDPASQWQEYGRLFWEAMAQPTTVKRHTNVLLHTLGYFKKNLSAADKEATLAAIERYHRQEIPLLEPLTLLRHWVRRFEQDYLADQHYLNPQPLEIMLNNHA